MCDGQKLLLIVVVLTNRHIHLTLFSTDIKILQTSFDILTSRLTPSATDRLLIIYGILLRHLFLCCRSCVPWVMRFFDTADVSALLLENNILLISSDRYFETVFWVAKSYTPFLCTYSLSACWFSNMDISQGSVTTRLRRGKILLYCKFTAESNSERILKIGSKHVAKVTDKTMVSCFFTHSVHYVSWNLIEYFICLQNRP